MLFWFWCRGFGCICMIYEFAGGIGGGGFYLVLCFPVLVGGGC